MFGHGLSQSEPARSEPLAIFYGAGPSENNHWASGPSCSCEDRQERTDKPSIACWRDHSDSGSLGHAQFDALVTDKHSRTGDEFTDLVLALAAERAMERFLGFAAADLCSSQNPDKIQVITAVTPQAKPAHTRLRRSPTRRRERWRRPRLINYRGSF
jgi:hypothetical protein